MTTAKGIKASARVASKVLILPFENLIDELIFKGCPIALAGKINTARKQKITQSITAIPIETAGAMLAIKRAVAEEGNMTAGKNAINVNIAGIPKLKAKHTAPATTVYNKVVRTKESSALFHLSKLYSDTLYGPSQNSRIDALNAFAE